MSFVDGWIVRGGRNVAAKLAHAASTGWVSELSRLACRRPRVTMMESVCEGVGADREDYLRDTCMCRRRSFLCPSYVFVVD